MKPSILTNESPLTPEERRVAKRALRTLEQVLTGRIRASRRRRNGAEKPEISVEVGNEHLRQLIQ